MPDWISHEPIVWTTLVGAVIALLVAFGVPISAEQKTAVITLVSAALAIYARSKVVPSAKIDEVPVAAAALKRAEAQ